MTDALALKGIEAAKNGLIRLYQSKGADKNARECMAFASLQSGVCLAQTGLGSVHGLASPLGAFFPIPHGTLLAEATKINIKALEQRADADNDNPALDKYAHLAMLMTAKNAHQALIDLLEDWTNKLNLPRLKSFGLQDSDLGKIVENSRGSSMKTNPIVLTDNEIRLILENRM